MGSLLELAIAFLRDLSNAVFITISPFMCTLALIMHNVDRTLLRTDSSGSLGAKSPLVLHHRMMYRHQVSCLPVITAWSIASKLELAFHHVPSTPISHPMP